MNEYLSLHLVFICLMVKSVVAYNCNPTLKAKFVELIKEHSKQEHNIMVFGNSFCDLEMMQWSDKCLISRNSTLDFTQLVLGNINLWNYSSYLDKYQSLGHKMRQIFKDAVYFMSKTLITYQFMFVSIPFRNITVFQTRIVSLQFMLYTCL